MGQEISEITRFLKRLQEFRIEKAVLFGSRARGDWLKESDWDLLLVSPDFEGMPFLERIRSVLDDWSSPVDLEVLCYTPDEFARKRKQIGIVRTAVREGIDLLVRQRAA